MCCFRAAISSCSAAISLLETLDVILFLLLRLVVGSFEFLDGFDERGQKLAIAHIVGARLVVVPDDQGEAVGGLRVFRPNPGTLRQGLFDILRYKSVAQRVVAIGVAEGIRAELIDEIQSQIGLRCLFLPYGPKNW